VIASAATSTYRPREHFKGIAECSIHVARNVRGAGAGSTALTPLYQAARDSGFHTLVSRIFPENLPSLRMVHASGFRNVGIYRRHGQLDGAWRDVVIVEKLL
jgi:L-amino acid N-acyltransferase YncA